MTTPILLDRPTTQTGPARTVDGNTRPIRHGRSSYANGVCTCTTCSGEAAAACRRNRRLRRERELATKYTAATLGIREFRGIRCSECGAGLYDHQGQPRWDILWPFRFVCSEGCAL